MLKPERHLYIIPNNLPIKIKLHYIKGRNVRYNACVCLYHTACHTIFYIIETRSCSALLLTWVLFLWSTTLVFRVAISKPVQATGTSTVQKITSDVHHLPSIRRRNPTGIIVMHFNAAVPALSPFHFVPFYDSNILFSGIKLLR